jgi:hypothetical protein
MAEINSADEVRSKVARYLSDAVEVGTEYLPGDISHVLFNTAEHVVQASALAAVEGEGDGFPAELAEIHADFEERQTGNTDLLAFKVAMALYTR